MNFLIALFKDNEEWLMQRVLTYAKESNYTKYTSTLKEAWRLSISGLTASLCEGILEQSEIPLLTPEDDFSNDPISKFGLIEARRHRERGVTLGMFLGLMKYYRQSYVDLLLLPNEGIGARERLYVDRCFDRFEVAFCQEWANTNTTAAMVELQTMNRFMTNEKNAYLTVFESLSDPVLMLDANEKLINLNLAAARIIDAATVPGGHYYQAENSSGPAIPSDKKTMKMSCIGCPVTDVLPWLTPTLESLRKNECSTIECQSAIAGKTLYFDVTRSDMLDVSEKFTATIIILRNISKRKKAEIRLQKSVTRLSLALSQVKKLSGLLPICASCKMVRDDKGYWSQVEEYISEHTDATFSHGICPDCIQKLYPQIAAQVLRKEKLRT